MVFLLLFLMVIIDANNADNLYIPLSLKGRLQNPLYSYKVKSLKICIGYCDRKKNCKSINFNIMTKECELGNTINEEELSTEIFEQNDFWRCYKKVQSSEREKSCPIKSRKKVTVDTTKTTENKRESFSPTKPEVTPEVAESTPEVTESTLEVTESTPEVTESTPEVAEDTTNIPTTKPDLEKTQNPTTLSSTVSNKKVSETPTVGLTEARIQNTEATNTVASSQKPTKNPEATTASVTSTISNKGELTTESSTSTTMKSMEPHDWLLLPEPPFYQMTEPITFNETRKYSEETIDSGGRNYRYVFCTAFEISALDEGHHHLFSVLDDDPTNVPQCKYFHVRINDKHTDVNRDNHEEKATIRMDDEKTEDFVFQIQQPYSACFYWKLKVVTAYIYDKSKFSEIKTDKFPVFLYDMNLRKLSLGQAYSDSNPCTLNDKETFKGTIYNFFIWKKDTSSDLSESDIQTVLENIIS